MPERRTGMGIGGLQELVLDYLERTHAGMSDTRAILGALNEVADENECLAAALRDALKCTGHWGDGLTEPAICRVCQAAARDALEARRTRTGGPGLPEDAA